MPPTAVITTNTTALGTKQEGCGSYSFKGTGSTLGTGRADQHIVKWDITAYPAGFEFSTIDPRFTELAGQPISSVINARDGGWYGWTFAFPMTHAGDYTVRLTVTDIDGNTDSTTTTVTVNAFAGETYYLDSGATGANDGSSWEDAYTNIDTVTALITNTRGGNSKVYVRGGTSYTPTAMYDARDDVNIGIYSDDADNPFIVDKQTAGWLRLRNAHNLTISGCRVINSVAADTSYFLDTLSSGGEDVYLHKCSVGGTNRMQSFMEAQFTANNPRFLIHDCQNTVGANRYALLYMNAQVDALGGAFENNADSTETVVRMAEPDSRDGLATFNGVNLTAREKSCIRFADGEFHTMSRCRLRGLDGGTWISTWMGSPTDDPGRVRIDRVSMYADAVGNDALVKCGNSSWNTVRTNATITFGACIFEVATGTLATTPIVDFDANLANNVYSCSFIGNTFLVDTATIGTWLQIPVEQDCDVLGNLFVYTGAAGSITICDIRPVSGTLNVDDNTFSPGLANNTDDEFYEFNNTAQDLATLNAQTGVGDNAEAAVTLDDDYNPTGGGSWDASGIVPMDFYGNLLEGTVQIGAINAGGSILRAPVPVGRKILIIGDSTNSKEGDAFVPYYERLLRHLASGSKVACVGLSINPGQTTDVSRQNASQSARLAEWVQQNPDASLPKTLDFTPPGFRVGDGVVNSPGLTSYAFLYATGIYDDADISPQGTEGWIAGGDIRISYAVSGGRTANDWLAALKLVRLSDHGGSTSIGSWSFTNLTDETIAKATDGLTRLDVTHASPADERVGLAVKPTGTGGDQASTIGDAIFISTCWVWDATTILDADAYALDSISIGGWAAEDWANTHDSADYAAYLSAMPYTPDTVIIWLGQNAGAGEWTGSVWTSNFDTHMETLIADVRAGFTAAGKDQPTIVLAAPPQMVDAYSATARMGLLRDRIETLAADNDCAFLDLWTPPGNSLINIDSGYSHSLGVHPTAAGADFVGAYFWDELEASLAPQGSGSPTRGRGRARDRGRIALRG